MRRTVAWPPDLRGGACRLTADPRDPAALDRGEALRQAIRLSLLDGSSAHPWNTGLGLPDPTFGAARAASRAIESRVADRFRALESERRARLVSVSVSVSGSTTLVVVDYEDLEQGDRRSLEVTGV